jgi:hypothetical protein
MSSSGKINRRTGIRLAARTMAGAHTSEADAPKNILRRVSLRSKPRLGGIAFTPVEGRSEKATGGDPLGNLGSVPRIYNQLQSRPNWEAGDVRYWGKSGRAQGAIRLPLLTQAV